MLKGGSELFEESSITRVEREASVIDDRTVELEISVTYENSFWPNVDWLETVDVYSGELISTTQEDRTESTATGETQVIAIMGRSVETEVFRAEWTADLGDGWTVTCEATDLKDPDSGFILKWEGRCDVVDPDGQWWGLETNSGEVQDTNLPLSD